MSIKAVFLLIMGYLSGFVSYTVSAQTTLSVKSITLSNGMTVWMNEDHTQPKIYGAVVVKAGAKDCPNSGIAHYLEHLLFKGTQRIGTIDFDAEKPWLDSISNQYDLLAKTTDVNRRIVIQRHINELSVKAADYAIPNEFSNLISLYGGTGLNAYTSFDETVFHNTFSPQYLRQWCELNAERLRDPVFRLFQGELETVYEEKNMYADNLLTSTAEKAQQYALAGTPYAYPILGATDSLKNPRLSEMMEFFKKYYIPENMGLILSGDLVTDSVLPLLEHTFGKLLGNHSNRINRSDFTNLTNYGTLHLKVPIPIVKIGGFAWRAPDDHSRDYAAFKVMTSMLTNEDKTGLIDSLTTNGKVLFAMGMGYDFKDFSAWGFGFVPRLPFGSRKKAEKKCFEQINKLKQGLFSDSNMEAEKLSLQRKRSLDLETISGRSKMMINAFSHGLAMEDMKARSHQIAAVTKSDIMRVARIYLNDDSLKIVKRFGRYPKEHVSQPGYKPVKPRNAGRQSVYAKQLAKQPVGETIPKFIDIEHGAEHVQLAPLVNLYSTLNAVDDVFTLQIIYRCGYRDDSRLEVLADFLNDIGTERHSKHQFGQLLRQQGATIDASASGSAVTITLTGFDDRFTKSMELLSEFLTAPKADKQQFKDLVQSVRLEEKTFFKQNRNIASAVMQKVEWGDDSRYLKRLSTKDLKRLGGDNLVSLFKDLQLCQTDIVYCGRRDAKYIENIVKSYVDVSKVIHARKPSRQQLKANEGKVVYIYDNPSARQTIVGTYHQIVPMRTAEERASLLLWGNYFGGGMQSVTFQEIREFRSLAYSAHGTTLLPDLRQQGDDPCGYVTLVGTQSDKAMQTIRVLDSLFSDMPLRKNNVVAARQSIINSINNSYPSFRSIGESVASLRLRGYVHDPNKDVFAALSGLGIKEVDSFYAEHIKRRPHAIIIVGNKKLLNMDELAKMGRVVELKKSDIFH